MWQTGKSNRLRAPPAQELKQADLADKERGSWRSRPGPTLTHGPALLWNPGAGRRGDPAGAPASPV